MVERYADRTNVRQQRKNTHPMLVNMESQYDLVWSNRRWKELKIVAKAWEYLSQWTVAQSRFTGPPLHPSFPGDGAVLWAKPQMNEVKISADATVFEDRGHSGIGLIARDHHGHLLSARTRSIPAVLNPSLAEAMTIKEALSWAKEMQGR